MTYKEILKMKLGDKTKVDEAFFKEVKRHLQVTWDDEDTNLTIADYIKDGVEVLQNDVGASIDFDEDRNARKLLRTYVRYAWNKSEEFFIQNNLEDILKLEVEYGKES